MNERMNE